MTYTEAQMVEINKDPERLRAYYWRIAQHWKLNYPQYTRIADEIIENLDEIVASHFRI
jgi:hypothetical protein